MSHFTQKSEPTLDDFLKDPIVRILMQRDGVSERKVRDIVAKASVTRHLYERRHLGSFCPRFTVHEEAEAPSTARNVEFAST